MSKSAGLRMDDGRAIINLVGECRELGDDWTGWLEHFNRGLMKLVDADLGMIGEIGNPRAAQIPWLSTPLISAQGGFTLDLDRVLEAAEYASANPDQFNFIIRYVDRLSVDDGVALHNRDFFRAGEWRSSLDMNIMGNAYGTDSTLLCVRRMPRSGRNENLNLTISRAKGRRGFTARDCTVVREAVSAIAPLMGGPLARFADPSPAGLPPRARQVLACLLEGDGDKQVAARLGISAHTVNQYAKVVFQHFGVRSRTELLARWVRRGWGDKFPWVD